MNNSQLSHIWANNPSKTAKGSNMFTDGLGTIFSYGHHFPIARHYKGAILFTSQDYSVSTARHKAYVSRACSHLNVFTVADPLAKPSRGDVKNYADKLADMATKVSRARDPEWLLGSLEHVTNEANKFCETFGFKTRFTMPDETKLAEYREKSQRAASLKAKATIARNAMIEIENQETVQRWLSGEQVSIPYNVQKVYLRCINRIYQGSAETMMLETSRNARVSLNEAKRAFAFIMAHKASGWHRNGSTFAIGDFQLDAVNEFGIVAGCHRIEWSEIERFAKLQNWTA